MSELVRGFIGKEDIKQWDGTTGTTFSRKTITGGSESLTRINQGGVDVLHVYGSGTNYTDEPIRTALNAIGSTNKVRLWLSRGVWTISNTVTFGSNITLHLEPGAVLTDDINNADMTINGDIIATPSQQIFDWTNGSGTLNISSMDRIYAAWFNGVDIGDKINNALSTLTTYTDTDIIITDADWNGKSFSTQILIDEPCSINFTNRGAAIYTGIEAAVKITVVGAKIIGGFHVDMTGNVNANVDGILIYGASDTMFSDGLIVTNAVRYGLHIQSTSNGCYNNNFSGLTRITNTGGACIKLSDLTGSNFPNANYFEHCVLTNPADNEACIEITDGYSNFFNSVYCQSSNTGNWAIYIDPVTLAGPNHIGHITIDSDMDNGIKVNNATLHISWIYNASSGTQYSELGNGVISRLNYTGTPTSPSSNFKIYYMTNSNNVDAPTHTQPAIFASDGTGAAPFDQVGNLIIRARNDATSKSIYFLYGSTPSIAGYINNGGSFFWNKNYTGTGFVIGYDGIQTKINAGAVTDGIFSATPGNGRIAIDYTNGRLYFRYSGSWHYCAQDAGFQINAKDIVCSECGKKIIPNQYVIGKTDREMEDGAIHGEWIHLSCANRI